MELLTPRLTLREFRETDFAIFRELEAHPATYHYESACPDETATRKYLENALADARQTPRTRYRFAVTIRPAEEVRGRVTLALLNDSIREWEIGWAIHPAEWGKGFGVEAAQRLLEFAFTDLGAHRVELDVAGPEASRGSELEDLRMGHVAVGLDAELSRGAG